MLEALFEQQAVRQPGERSYNALLADEDALTQRFPATGVGWTPDELAALGAERERLADERDRLPEARNATPAQARRRKTTTTRASAVRL